MKERVEYWGYTIWGEKRDFLIRLEEEVYVRISNIYLYVLTSEGRRRGKGVVKRELFFKPELTALEAFHRLELSEAQKEIARRLKAM